jgi:LmbE family N-acetylglucosaminyl deacetylase
LRIVSIHAHPDDAEILVGGTLAQLRAAGHDVTIVTMTPGDCGTRDYPPEEIAAIRRREAARGAAVIGAHYICAEFRDLAIFNDDPSRRRVAELLRKVQPDVVLTASPVDYHCDHEATSILVRDACFGAPAPNYICGTEPRIPEIPHLYFLDPAEGRDRDGNVIHPEFIVDVTSTLAVKREMLACHESQRKWLQEHHHMDNYIETMEEWTRARGALAGFQFGEGFRQYRCHPYPTTPILQDALAGLVRNIASA